MFCEPRDDPAVAHLCPDASGVGAPGSSEHVLQMQRALDQMKVRLHPVISQWHGVSGLAVVDAILAGERDPAKLLAWCDASIRRAKDEGCAGESGRGVERASPL